MRQEEALAKINPLRAMPGARFGLESSTGEAEGDSSSRTDIVLVTPLEPAASRHFAQPRPQAAFLAHLLAVAQHAPQTQEKRRAEPLEATNRYAAAGKAVPARPGLSLKRAV
jgi:hypothetical protein